MPAARPHAADAAHTDLGCEERTKPILPVPEYLPADSDATLMKQVVDVPQREREYSINVGLLMSGDVLK